MEIVYIYLAVISVIAMVITCHDKRVSKKHGARRVPEKVLLMLSALGGSVAMMITMLIIRHKTRHVKFMLGIPLIIAMQLALVYFLFSEGVLHF